MPYIPSSRRNYFLLSSIKDLLLEPTLLRAGELNFLISTLIWRVFESDPCYSRANELMGVLESVKQEFYRRKVAPYEDQKIQENGDV